MYTYTTPSITCALDGIELASVDYVRIAIVGKGGKIIRVVPAADIDAETNEVVVTLSQEETASLGKGQIGIQARIRYNDGTVQPTNKVFKDMNEVFDKVVI